MDNNIDVPAGPLWEREELSVMKKEPLALLVRATWPGKVVNEEDPSENRNAWNGQTIPPKWQLIAEILKQFLRKPTVAAPITDDARNDPQSPLSAMVESDTVPKRSPSSPSAVETTAAGPRDATPLTPPPMSPTNGGTNPGDVEAVAEVIAQPARVGQDWVMPHLPADLEPGTRGRQRTITVALIDRRPDHRGKCQIDVAALDVSMLGGTRREANEWDVDLKDLFVTIQNGMSKIRGDAHISYLKDQDPSPAGLRVDFAELRNGNNHPILHRERLRVRGEELWFAIDQHPDFLAAPSTWPLQPVQSESTGFFGESSFGGGSYLNLDAGVKRPTLHEGGFFDNESKPPARRRKLDSATLALHTAEDKVKIIARLKEVFQRVYSGDDENNDYDFFCNVKSKKLTNRDIVRYYCIAGKFVCRWDGKKAWDLKKDYNDKWSLGLHRSERQIAKADVYQALGDGISGTLGKKMVRLYVLHHYLGVGGRYENEEACALMGQKEKDDDEHGNDAVPDDADTDDTDDTDDEKMGAGPLLKALEKIATKMGKEKTLSEKFDHRYE